MAFDKVQITTVTTEILVAQGLCSKAALNLQLGTMAAESDFGTFLYQRPSRIAQGIFQMEPATERDIWDNYLRFRPERRSVLTRICGVLSLKNNGAMTWNLAYQICMARFHYRRVKEPFPAYNDVAGLGYYWKQYWNTVLGKGTVEGFVQAYDKYIG